MHHLPRFMQTLLMQNLLHAGNSHLNYFGCICRIPSQCRDDCSKAWRILVLEFAHVPVVGSNTCPPRVIQNRCRAGLFDDTVLDVFEVGALLFPEERKSENVALAGQNGP